MFVGKADRMTEMKRWLYTLIVLGATLAITTNAQETNLPPVDILLDQVLQRAKQEHANDRHFKTRYAYVRTRIKREFDGKGHVKKEETKQSRNNPVVVPTSYNPTPTVATPISQTNQPQTAASNRSFDKNDFILNKDLLKRFDFTLIKREDFNGRPCFLIDFKPTDKKLPCRNIKERFMSKAAGTVWIDEEDLVLAKTDLHLIDTVNVVGGLVGAVKKFNYTLARVRTPDGLWYADDVRWRLEGREIFSRKVMEYEETRSEVKKVR